MFLKRGIFGVERDWLKRFFFILILLESCLRVESVLNLVFLGFSCFFLLFGCRNLLVVWLLVGCEFDGVFFGIVIVGDFVKWFIVGRSWGRLLFLFFGFGIMKINFLEGFMLEVFIFGIIWERMENENYMSGVVSL